VAQASFADWTERLKVYNDYIRALADLKLKTAEADLQNARAANEMAVVRLKEVVIGQLERDLRAFNRAIASERRSLEQFNKKDRAARLLLRGSRILSGSFVSGWSGYVFFESRALLEAGDRLFRIRVSKAARKSSNFISISNQQTADDAPPDIENALQLMQWLHEKRYLAARGSMGQFVVVKLFQEINQIAKDAAEAIRTRMSEMRSTTYDVWKLRTIFGASDSPAAKRIEATGEKTS
jgi:hypothetical protein